MNLTLPLRPFYSNIGLLSFLLFLTGGFPKDLKHRTLTSCFFHMLGGGGGQENKFCLRNPIILLALVHTFHICEFHFKSLVIVTPRYLML